MRWTEEEACTRLGLLDQVKTHRGSSLFGAFHLTGGAVISQVVNFATTLIIARLYTPADIGLLAAILAIALTITPLVTLGLQVSIVPAGTDSDAIQLARLALGSTLLGALLAAVILLAAPLPSDAITQHQGLVLAFVPAMLLIMGSFAVLSQLALRQRLFGPIATRGVLQSVSIGGIQTGGFLLAPSGLWLFTGELLGRAIGVASLIPSAVRFRRKTSGPVTKASRIFRDYSDSWRFYLPAAFLEVAAGQIGVILIAAWFGTTEAGYLGLTTRVLSVPVVLIGAAVGQVLNTELARRRRSGQTDRSKQRLRQLIAGLVGISLLISLALFIFGPWAFSLAFGEEWRASGELARYLGIPTAVGLVWHPISAVFTSYLRLRTFLTIAALRLMLSLSVGTALWAAGQGWVIVVVGMAAGVASAQVLGIWLAWRVVDSDSSATSRAIDELNQNGGNVESN